MTMIPTSLSRKLLLAVVILIGVFFRLHQIADLPPGDGFDPAYYGLDALLILDGELPIYLPTNYGREPLFSYLVATMFLLLGPGTAGIHIASALVGIFTIPALYLVGDELFKLQKMGMLRRWGGVLAALILAISFWHLNWSRYGVRAILIPLVFSLTMFFLLRGLRKRRAVDFTAAGILLGISFYTYQLAQLLPLLLFLILLYDVISRRSFKKQEMRPFLLVFGTALLLWLPLAAYAFTHPGVFNQRVGDVFIFNDSSRVLEQLPLLLEKGRQVLLLFAFEGDLSPMTNLPARPLFNPFLSFFFLAGILISIWRFRQARTLVLLLWLALMVTPVLLAEKAALGKRALGALPAVLLLITVGLLWPLDNLMGSMAIRDMKKKWTAVLYLALISGGLLFTAYNTYQDYFIRWGSISELYNTYDVGVKEIGQYIAALPAEETIYLSPTWQEHASLRLHANQRDDMHSFNGRHCFVFPQRTENTTTYLIVPEDDKNSLALLAKYFPQGAAAHEGILGNGEHYFTAYQIPAGSPAQFSPHIPLEANWDNQIKLLGFGFEMREYAPGETVTVNLFYQPLADMPTNYTSFIHLWGDPDLESGNIIYGQEDREPCFESYPTSFWQEGEVIRDSFRLTIADDAKPGQYQLVTGFYKWPELTQLSLSAASAATEGNALLLNELTITE